MNNTEQNQAREEYFSQLIELINTFNITPYKSEEDAMKDKILGVTYDANAALQKRVEELEAALKGMLEILVSPKTGYIYTEANKLIRSRDLGVIKTAQKLLTKQS